MDVQHQTKSTTPSGHESHGVHLCHRCGWPFPNPHPSARHRRTHKNICGTIEGYTTLIDSGVVSDDEHHPDEDLEKSPSPETEKKNIITESAGSGAGGGGSTAAGGGFGGRSGRSEEDLFSDAVTEFSDSGTSPGLEDRSDSNKTLDSDLFFSFKDAENGGTKEAIDSAREIVKTDDSLRVSETPDTQVEKTKEIKAKAGLLEADGSGFSTDKVEKIQPSGISSVGPVSIIGEDKDAENQDLEASKIVIKSVDSLVEAEVSVTAGEDDNGEKKSGKLSDVAVGEKVEEYLKIELDHECALEVVKECESDQIAEAINEIKHETIESDHEHAPEDAKESEIDQSVDGIGEIKHETIRLDSEVVKESEIGQSAEGISEIKRETSESDHDRDSEVVKESEIDQSAEGISEIKHETSESDHDRVLDVVKESEIDRISEEIKKAESELDHEHASEAVKESGIKHEKFESDHEQAPEVVEKPETDHGVSVLTEKEVLGAPESEKRSKEHNQEVLEEPKLVLIEKVDLGVPESNKCSEEHTQAVLKEPDSVLTKKADLDAPESEKCSKEQAQEVAKIPNSVLTEKVDLDEPDSVLTEKKNLGALDSQKCVKVQTPEATEEPKTDDDSKVVAEGVDDRSEKITPREAEQSVHPSDLVSEPIVEESNQKPTNNQDSGVYLSADSSSHNSLEGNWGSVSVLSTASIDDKSKPDSAKPVAADRHSGSSDIFEPPSFMTLVESKGDATDQNPAATGGASVQQPNPEEPQDGWFPTLTNISNESEGRKRNEEVIAKVTNWSTGKQHSTPLKNLLGEAKSPASKPPPATVAQKDEAPVANHDSSPPKLIENDKKVRKKSWVPFVCCSSVNVVN